MKRMFNLFVPALALVALLGSAAVFAGGPKLPNCPIMGEPVNLAVSTATDDGPVFFCCKGCVKKFESSPGKYASDVASQRKALTGRARVQVKCPVTSEPVNPKVFTEHNGEKVSFCCKGCLKKFTADPGKYKAGLANSYTYQTKCPVMGETINPTVSSVLATGETVYYCCKGCDKKFVASPEKYATKLASQGIVLNLAALKKASSHDHDHGHGGHGHDHSGHGHGGHDHDHD